MQRVNRLNFWSVAVALIAWVIMVLAVSFYTFFASIDRHIEEHAVTSLQDVSKSISQLLQTKIEGQWATLAPVAKFAGEEKDILGSDTLLQIMHDMKTTSNFSMVFVTDHTGKSITNEGVFVDVADRYYFKQAMQGYNNLSQILQSRTTGEDVFVFASPVLGDSGARGALSAVLRVEDFQNLIDLSIFEGMGYTYIISGTGDVLVESIVAHHPIRNQNVIHFLSEADAESSIDADRLKENMLCRQKGHFTFVSNEDVQNAYYMPLGINDWYILCGVPLDYLKDQSSVLSWIALRLCFGILAALAPVALVLWIEEKSRKANLLIQNQELQWNEERFRIVTSLSNSIIFEADLEKGAMIYPNGFRARMGYDPVEEGFPLSLVQAGHIHPDDAESFIHIHSDIPPFTEKLSGEFRLKGQGGNFIWHRIEEVLLLDEKGKAIKSIGRALDIDDEKKAMALLEARSQIDSGSGLCNKNATELYIKRCLKEDPEGWHAMVVLDIDEFKSINDSKGHLYGDQVIADLADVLKSQFRASDILGRIGGDEFMVFIRDIPNELFVAVKIAKIRNTIMKMHQTGISAGIAIFPKDGKTYVELYKHADMAMYSVKKKGKSGFEFFVDMIKH